MKSVSNNSQMIKELYIIRHGQTEYNKKGIIQGSGVDMPLNETGHLQSSLFHNRYRHENFDIVVHTNLVRTKETVHPFLLDNNSTVLEMSELREISWGKYEGKPYDPVMKGDYDNMINAWGRGDYTARLEGGESAQELYDRVKQGIDKVLSLDAGKILICSHGRTMRCIMCVIESLHLRHMETVNHSNTGLYKIRIESEKRIVQMRNNTSHLNEMCIS